MCRFYSFSHVEVESLTVEEAGEYYACMNILRAREQMDSNISNTWPHMEKDDRKKQHKILLKDADFETKKRAVTAQDIARIIGT